MADHSGTSGLMPPGLYPALIGNGSWL